MIQKMGIMGNIFRYLPNSIYGYDIAVKDALSAILRYGTFQSLVVFYFGLTTVIIVNKQL